MTQGDRVKKIRKASNLTLEEFGKKLGVTKVAISNIENGNRNLTTQMMVSIIREFSVNEEWLRTGEGEMFIQLPEEDEYMKAYTRLSMYNDKDAMDAVIKYWKLDPSSKKAIWDFIHSLSKK